MPTKSHIVCRSRRDRDGIKTLARKHDRTVVQFIEDLATGALRISEGSQVSPTDQRDVIYKAAAALIRSGDAGTALALLERS